MKKFDLPKGWEWRKLGNKKCFEIIMGQSPPSKSYNLNGNGLPFFQGKAEFGEIYPTPRKFCTEPKRFAEVNDVLISVRAPVGPTNLVNQRCCIGRGLASIRCKEKVSFKFLLYALRNYEKQIAYKVQDQGGGFTAIKRNQLANIEIPVPPLKEQQRIVSRIEELTKRVKEIQSLSKKVLGDIEEYISFSIISVFSIANKGKWESESFSTVIRRINSKEKKIKKKDYNKIGKYPIIDQGFSPVAGYTDDEIKLYDSTLPVVIFGDHTKNVKYIDFKFAVGADGVVILRSNDSILPKFFFYWLKNIQLHNLGYSRHFKLLKDLVIQFPKSHGQQNAIVEYIDRLETKVESLKFIQSKIEKEMSSFSSALLDKAFRGKL